MEKQNGVTFYKKEESGFDACGYGRRAWCKTGVDYNECGYAGFPKVFSGCDRTGDNERGKGYPDSEHIVSECKASNLTQ